MADAPSGSGGGAAIECTRSMGCKCSQCNMDLAALGDVTNSAKAGGSAAEPCAAGPATVYTFAALNYNADRVVGEAYDVEKDGKLGSVYTMLTEVLAARGDWLRAKAVRNTIEDAEGAKKSEELKLPRSFQLLLGTAQGKGIKFGQLGYGMWPPPLVNYYRGFNTLCRKASLIQTLREAATCAQEESQLLSMMPETFLFYPSHAEDEALNEHAQLAGAFEARAEALAVAGGGENIWILKPSDGAKGERIELMSELPKIQAFLKAQAESESTSGWVVQQYIDRPLLLRGGRKFDVRCWVLLDPDYKVYLYREGVLRTGAVAYSVTASPTHIHCGLRNVVSTRSKTWRWTTGGEPRRQVHPPHQPLHRGQAPRGLPSRPHFEQNQEADRIASLRRTLASLRRQTRCSTPNSTPTSRRSLPARTGGRRIRISSRTSSCRSSRRSRCSPSRPRAGRCYARASFALLWRLALTRLCARLWCRWMAARTTTSPSTSSATTSSSMRT